MNTFYDFFFSQVLRDPADTSGCKVVISGLHAPQAAKALVTWLHRLDNKPQLLRGTKNQKNTTQKMDKEQDYKSKPNGQGEKKYWGRGGWGAFHRR